VHRKADELPEVIMRKRIFVVIAAVLVSCGLFAGPAGAQRIWPLIGCDSYLDWPWPGPVLAQP
jgi:hypothetical protein